MNLTVRGHSIGIGWLIALIVFIFCVLDVTNVWTTGPEHVDAWLIGLLSLAFLVG